MYNLAWGALVILFPGLIFRLAGIAPINYPQIWQCVGMIVGVYGMGYLIAARNSRVHWPIVLVGLLGKVLGPLGFAFALLDGSLPLAFGATILTNDLLWWIPFTMILWDAARSRGELPAAPRPSLDEALDRLRDQHGRTLRERSDAQPCAVVLLRHTGCTFCRQSLSDLRSRRAGAADGMHLAIVTMSSPEENANLARQYGLESVSWFSDPDRIAYRAFDLRRGTFLQLFGPAVWWSGLRALLDGHGLGALSGDGFQLPGAFVVHRGRVVAGQRARSAAERLDCGALGACLVPNTATTSAIGAS